MEFDKLFIDLYISKIPELLDRYNEKIDLCENLAYVFCGMILIPYIGEKYLNAEYDVLQVIFKITDDILGMESKELTAIIRLGIIENLVPERELIKGVEGVMPKKLLDYSKTVEAQLGW